ncbi:MAG TPA: ZIP family metal transporter, partial [Bacteroidia bacterium]|nr:ZIP family metal transporter [Bacteroidia bacterium]
IFYPGTEETKRSLVSFLTGITLHNVVISIAFAGLLLHQHLSKGKVFYYLVLFSSMAPLGALTGFFLERTFTGTAQLASIFTALVIGIFLHISTTIIFESSEKNHRYHISKLLSILTGLALAYILSN